MWRLVRGIIRDWYPAHSKATDDRLLIAHLSGGEDENDDYLG